MIVFFYFLVVAALAFAVVDLSVTVHTSRNEARRTACPRTRTTCRY